MSAAKSVDQRKQNYFAKLTQLLEEYSKVFIVGADNVGSNHLQKIRQSLRGEATVLMGKNTMMRKAIRDHLAKNDAWDSILPLVKGNVGFVFVSGDLGTVRSKLLSNRVAAPAKAGIVAPNDVWVPKGNTGMEPTQTAFLQALNIPSKINKGQIEITNDVFLIKTGQKVGNSEATLLSKLNIKPFSYGLSIKYVYDNGAVYEPNVLDLTDEDLLGKFRAAVSNVAALGLEIGYPTIASLPHSIINGFKNVLAVGLNTDYTFDELEKVKKVLENPGAYAAAAPAAATTAPTTTTTTKVEEKEQPKEEEDEDMGLGLFD
jgi:large subunit ribosomal protein LP0